MEVELSTVARHLVASFRELARNEMTRMVNGGCDVPPERLARRRIGLSRSRLVRVLRGLREVAWQHSPDVLSISMTAVEK